MSDNNWTPPEVVHIHLVDLQQFDEFTPHVSDADICLPALARARARARNWSDEYKYSYTLTSSAQKAKREAVRDEVCKVLHKIGQSVQFNSSGTAREVWNLIDQLLRQYQEPTTETK